MTVKNPDPLLVELFLSNGRIQGLTHEVHERRRLVDVLTDSTQALRLDAAKVLLGGSPTTREFANINVEKRSILAAIPHETQQQIHQRSMLTTTVGKSETRPVKVTLLLPPLIAEGSMHLPRGAGNIGANLNADAQLFARFVSVTGATLTLPGGAELPAPVLLVNRDLIAGISVVEDRRMVEDTFRRSA